MDIIFLYELEHTLTGRHIYTTDYNFAKSKEQTGKYTVTTRVKTIPVIYHLNLLKVLQ